MHRVGQVEFLAIFALIIVAIVVIFFASGSFTVPSQPTQLSVKQESIKNDVVNFIRAGTDETLREVSRTGGIAYESRDIEWFTGKPVVFWQKNGVMSIPNLEKDFADSIQSYIENNKDGFQNALDSDVVLGSPSVTVSIFDSKIDVSVTMPTTIDNTPLNIPYTVSVPTKLGEAIEFAKGFARQQQENRYLEYYTVSSFAVSPFNDGHHAVPLYVTADNCGDFVYLDWWEIQPEAETSIKRTLANIYMPGKAPLNTMNLRTSPKYPVPSVNGKEFEDLKVSFHVPDEFGLDQESFQFTPNPITAQAEVIPFVGQCFSNPVYVQYQVRYPVIVRVKDPVTENTLNFALDVFITDNSPGTWGTGGYEPSIDELLCHAMLCSADVTVARTDGKPISGATVSFMGCGLGRTDTAGHLSAKAPCGGGLLEVYAQGYDSYKIDKNHAGLDKVSVTLAKRPTVTLHFYQVNVVQDGANYKVFGDALQEIGENTVDLQLLRQEITGAELDSRRYKSSGTMMIDTGNYGFVATIRNSETGEAVGSLVTSQTFTEGSDSQTLYVYIPALVGYSGITDTGERLTTDANLRNFMEDCGFGPVSSSEVELGFCELPISSL